MASRQALTSGVRCFNCQSHVLKSFISSFSLLQQQCSASQRPPQRAVQRRTFSAHSTRLAIQDIQGEDGEKPFAALEGLEDEDTALKPEDEQTSVASVPWYLQDEDIPLPPLNEGVNPMLERQRIPEIPQDAPPILEPLLKQISVDLGMDYLSIMDLRKLDPPPALGANLLMVLGSARSEKHLNVSADRLCRWLRTEYKLSPVADGLLGRNELKLKLRRRARRMKMLGSSAAADLTSADDGISTGWVCVDVGTVENGKGQNTAPTEEPKFVGFGRRTDGAKIVVQLMTEEKRGEVDLEGLWQGIFDRAMRKKTYDAEAQAEIDEEAGLQLGEGVMNVGTSDPSRNTFSQRSTRSSPVSTAAEYPPRPRQRVRGFHTSSRLHQADLSSLTASNDEMLDEFELEPQLMPQTGLDTPSNTAFGTLSQALSTKTLLDYLKQVPPATAIKVLGNGEHDRTSTTFLQSFYSGFPAFLESQHWDSALQLHCYAIKIGHTGYTRGRLMETLRALQASTVELPAHAYMNIFETMILAPHALDESSWVKGTKYDAINALRRSLGWGFEVLEKMAFRGHSVCTEKTFAILHLAITYPKFAPAPTNLVALPGEEPKPLSISTKDIVNYQYLSRMAIKILWGQSTNNLDILMMRSYIEQDNWAGFWHVWRLTARTMRPRTPEMYAILFRGIAGTGNQAKCQEALNDQISEMQLEEPPVALEGDVADAVRSCLIAAQVNLREGIWAKLWTRVSPPDLVE